MSFVPISSTPSSNNTKSSLPTCATSWSQTTSPIFHLRKGLDHLHAVRERFQTITDRFAGFPCAMAQASMSTSRCCNVSPSPSPSAQSAYPGIKLHASARHPPLRGPPARRQPRRRLDRQANPSGCPRHLPALRHTLRHQPTAPYDLRNHSKATACCSGMDPAAPTASPQKASRLRCCSSSSTKICRSLAHSRFHHRPVARHQPPSKLETAYHRADKAIQQIVDLPA